MPKQTSTYVAGVGNVVLLGRDFYTNLLELERQGARVITPSQEIKARLRTQGKEDIGKDCGTYVTAGLEYIKEESPILRLMSRLLKPELARQAVEANRQRSYFHTQTIKEYEQSAEQAEKEQKQGKKPWKKSVLVLPSRASFNITSNENLEVLQFLARSEKLARKYFEFNGSHPMKTYLLDNNTVDSQDGTLMTQLWIGDLDNGSVFVGNGRYFDYSRWVRGMLKRIGEASSQTRKLGKTQQIVKAPYTQRQLTNNLKRVEGVRQGRLGVSRLEKVIEFLDKLKKEY